MPDLGPLGCAICRGALRLPVTAACGAHNFCDECLSTWLKHAGEKVCPTCRAPQPPGPLRVNADLREICDAARFTIGAPLTLLVGATGERCAGVLEAFDARAQVLRLRVGGHRGLSRAFALGEVKDVDGDNAVTRMARAAAAVAGTASQAASNDDAMLAEVLAAPTRSAEHERAVAESLAVAEEEAAFAAALKASAALAAADAAEDEAQIARALAASVALSEAASGEAAQSVDSLAVRQRWWAALPAWLRAQAAQPGAVISFIDMPPAIIACALARDSAVAIAAGAGGGCVVHALLDGDDRGVVAIVAETEAAVEYAESAVLLRVDALDADADVNGLRAFFASPTDADWWRWPAHAAWLTPSGSTAALTGAVAVPGR